MKSSMLTSPIGLCLCLSISSFVSLLILTVVKSFSSVMLFILYSNVYIFYYFLI